ETLVNEAAGEIEDPERKMPVAKRLRLHRIADAKNEEERREARERANVRIDSLGSGSDYTTFLDHLGIASTNFGFGGEGGGGGASSASCTESSACSPRSSAGSCACGPALPNFAGPVVARRAAAALLP